MTARVFASLFLLAVASGAQARDALLEQALSRASMPSSQLRGSIRTTTTTLGGKRPETQTSTVDLGKSPDRALAAYDELRQVIGPDAHAIERQAGRTIYAFTTHRLPRGSTGDGRVEVDGNGSEQVFEGKAEVSVDAEGRPYVSHVDLHLPRAEGTLLARVRKIDVNYAFAPAAGDDAMVTTAVSVDVDVRALFFMHRDVHADSVFVMDTSRP